MPLIAKCVRLTAQVEWLWDFVPHMLKVYQLISRAGNLHLFAISPTWQYMAAITIPSVEHLHYFWVNQTQMFLAPLCWKHLLEFWPISRHTLLPVKILHFTFLILVSTWEQKVFCWIPSAKWFCLLVQSGSTSMKDASKEYCIRESFTVVAAKYL